MVSKFVDYASLSFDRINKTRLINSEDIVSAIVEGQKRANENKIVLQIKDPTKSK
jgi:predicted metal-dependent phosphotriesterase family hydrolase